MRPPHSSHGQHRYSRLFPPARRRQWREANNRSLHIELDGGINAGTAELCREAGADVFVAGTSIFHQEDYRAAINALRG